VLLHTRGKRKEKKEKKAGVAKNVKKHKIRSSVMDGRRNKREKTNQKSGKNIKLLIMI